MAASYNWDDPKKEGPWGGEGGTEWSYKPKAGISEIIIGHGWFLDSISFKSIDEKGTLESSKKFGGDGGDTTKISIEWPKEYLTSINGTYAPYENSYAIQSLNIKTNLNSYGPFGNTDGTPYNFSMEDGVIVGFFGLAGSTLVKAIGVYAKKSSHLFSPPSPVEVVTPQINSGVTMNMDMPRIAGPWGGNNGHPWDDGSFLAIKQVDVRVGNGIIHAIVIQYQSNDGKSTVTKKHGGDGGDFIYRFKLDGSNEYLVGIRGFYGPAVENGGSETLRCLTFYTNKGNYGPFGKEIGTFFSSPVFSGRVIGFHGRSGLYLNALGVHIEYS